jgi:hypothetical protein
LKLQMAQQLNKTIKLHNQSVNWDASWGS